MSGLPTGTVTFLFTDMVGSSRLWESDREAMRLAARKHDKLIADAVASAGGHVFKHVGDGICAAFQSPASAVEAAAAAQIALVAEDWRAPGSIAVRMAIHTGLAERCGDDYEGPSLNRCSRIEDLAHGGQILLSLSTYALVRDDLPPGVSLRDLGEHRLRDLARAESLYQVVLPDLPSEFPPLRSLDALPHNLPVRLSNFIGRHDEMGEVVDQLSRARLLTLTGPGGVGKTRLALQVAAELVPQWSDGAWLADLAPMIDRAQVVQAVAASLKVREEAGSSMSESLVPHCLT